MITQSRLKELLLYDSETGVFTWKGRRGGFAIKGSAAGAVSINGYIYIGVDGKLYLAHRLAWFWDHGRLPNEEIDHINRIKTDNRLVNLREVSHRANMINKPLYLNNTSGFRGVIQCSRSKKWLSYIRASGRKIHLGTFDQVSDAVISRSKAEDLYGHTEIRYLEKEVR